MIEFINVDKIHPHQDNPRKDLGDLTELSESIKKSGVLQNLTVIPCTGYYHGDYTVIIGHRRLAAAKLAGLSEVPCVVTEMDEKEQIATMLLENMQRSDLTVYEQAQGIQMMLDLGDSVNEISEKTGFSESTIRRRTKLLMLDNEKFKESQERQVTLSEYDKLFEIEDDNTRSKLLGSIGTANFNNEFRQAKDAEANKRKKAELIIELDKFAERADNGAGKRYVTCIYKRADIPEVREDVQYYYIDRTCGSWVDLYRDYTEEEKAERDKNQRAEEERLKKQKEKVARNEQFNELSERFFKLRYDFIKNCADLRKKVNVLCEFAAWSSVLWTEVDEEDLQEITGKKFIDDEEEFDTQSFCEYLKGDAFRGLLYTAYIKTGDSKNEKYHNAFGTHKENSDLDKLYEFLCDLGYEMSDEEKVYRDGTHELFCEV